MADYPKCCVNRILTGMPEDASTARELKYMILQDASLGELRIEIEEFRNKILPVYVAQYENLGLY
jgi:hypothetical protein